MSNEQYNVKNNSNKSASPPFKMNEAQNGNFSTYQNQHNSTENNINFMQNDKYEVDNRTLEDKAERKKREGPFIILGLICVGVALTTMLFSYRSGADTSQAAKDALKNKVSTTVSAGIILSNKDGNSQASDYTITNKSNAKDTKVWIWDYAAEDGDYVQVLVNGAPIGDAFMIKHKPKEITVPAEGKVQIKGIKDGGGGITYAVRYDINGTSYFNAADVGKSNTYTFTK
ncbi:MAG: hypothetical protein Q8936_10915 [Bacillota bacterium]|nr:hypothetical protein [Bacillota bacterium]